VTKLKIIAGATASGKTSAAVQLAQKIDGEVASADSMQVYRHMNIGTAKPTKAEMGGIPHHLLDVVDPSEPFSVAEYQTLAVAAIKDIQARGKTAILAGGTGFYINAVLNGVDFSTVVHENEFALRKHFTEVAKEKGAEYLHSLLAEKDPVHAAIIHANNVKRVARALAYCESTGKLFSEYNARQKTRQPLFHADFYVISMPRETLYSRINARTLAMFEGGLEGEVRGLLKQGYHEALAPMQGIGYKEVIKFLKNEYTKDETISAIQQSTRNYAKRQETWFRHQAPTARLIYKEDVLWQQ